MHNFRLYEEAYFEFGPQINMICGPNAQGKTSLLEAIYFLISGKSFRTSQTSDLIRHGAQHFHLDAKFVKHDIEQRIRITCGGKERKIIYNNTAFPSIVSLLGLLLGVVICPDDIALIKGPPQGRRQFLDTQISQADPLYAHHLSRYQRAMQQRNYLLRARSLNTIDSWEHEMAQSAAYLTRQRHAASEQLLIQAKGLYQVVADKKEDLQLTYKAGVKFSDITGDLKPNFLEMYRKNRFREMELSYTLHGPHKDDLDICFSERNVRDFASEGQQRSCAGAMRFAEWKRIQLAADETPLMLVDDVGVSLDQGRRERLFGMLANLSQVFLTSTEDLPVNAEKKIIRL